MMDIDLEILINIRYLIPVSLHTVPNTINQPIIDILYGFVKWEVERGYLKHTYSSWNQKKDNSVVKND